MLKLLPVHDTTELERGVLHLRQAMECFGGAADYAPHYARRSCRTLSEPDGSIDELIQGLRDSQADDDEAASEALAAREYAHRLGWRAALPSVAFV